MDKKECYDVIKDKINNESVNSDTSKRNRFTLSDFSSEEIAVLRKVIIDLYEKNVNVCDISYQMNLTPRSVLNTIKLFKKHGDEIFDMCFSKKGRRVKPNNLTEFENKVVSVIKNKVPNDFGIKGRSSWWTVVSLKKLIKDNYADEITNITTPLLRTILKKAKEENEESNSKEEKKTNNTSKAKADLLGLVSDMVLTYIKQSYLSLSTKEKIDLVLNVNAKIVNIIKSEVDSIKDKKLKERNKLS